MIFTKPILFNTLLGLALLGSQVKAEEVKIAVAANFTDATREIAPLFEKATGHKPIISYGSTGKLYSQIEHGAPFELFLAADTERPIKAEQEGLAVPATRFIYAKGKLVLWSIKSDLFESGERYLKRGAFEHLALANPKTAPYGLAAEQVMRHLGVLEQLTPKLVKGDSIAQTFQFAATGNANVAFIALAQIKGWQGDMGTLWEIPDDYYAPIEQAAVLLKKGEHNPAAIAYLEFLKSDEAREVIERYGYGVE
ncbi:MAG: molybdate ABC transporter substrate-binding protein [Candidatus Thiodiazotropha sp.]|jgi:molybdate transport system substrate-binding protein